MPKESPSGLALLCKYLAAISVPAPVMFSTINVGISRNVLAHVARHGAGINVEAAAGAAADNDANRFTLIKLGRMNIHCECQRKRAYLAADI